MSAGVVLARVVQIMGCASQPPVSDVPASPSPAITDFWTFETPETVAVMVKSDRPLTHRRPNRKTRQAFYSIPGSRLGRAEIGFTRPESVIRSIRAKETAGNDREAQVFLELSQDLPYNVYSEAEGLRITFQKPLAAIL
jgi:hypothetical protein